MVNSIAKFIAKVKQDGQLMIVLSFSWDSNCQRFIYIYIDDTPDCQTNCKQNKTQNKHFSKFNQ